jgi:hypothetical protein
LTGHLKAKKTWNKERQKFLLIRPEKEKGVEKPRKTLKKAGNEKPESRCSGWNKPKKEQEKLLP